MRPGDLRLHGLGSAAPTARRPCTSSLVVKLRELPGRIKAMLTTVKQPAPNARIVLTGYPRLFTVGAGSTAEQTQRHGR